MLAYRWTSPASSAACWRRPAARAHRRVPSRATAHARRFRTTPAWSLPRVAAAWIALGSCCATSAAPARLRRCHRHDMPEHPPWRMDIALIADTHLSKRTPECIANFVATAHVVAAAEPDLTIHLGDITLDGQHHREELPFAAGLLQLWPTVLR